MTQSYPNWTRGTQSPEVDKASQSETTSADTRLIILKGSIHGSQQAYPVSHERNEAVNVDSPSSCNVNCPRLGMPLS